MGSEVPNVGPEYCIGHERSSCDEIEADKHAVDLRRGPEMLLEITFTSPVYVEEPV